MTFNAEQIAAHVALLKSSYTHWTGQALPIETLAVVSHGTEPDPIFNYANAKALALFEMTWPEFTQLPSRLSASAPSQTERARLLKEVSEKGFIQNYSGQRISKSGKRFGICNGTVWNVVDAEGRYHGQAACFEEVV